MIKKLKRRKVYARFRDLAEMWSLSSSNCAVKFLLCDVDVFTKYTCVEPLKDRKVKTVLNGFVEIVNKSKRKPNKLWVDQGREIYNSHMQKIV